MCPEGKWCPEPFRDCMVPTGTRFWPMSRLAWGVLWPLPDDLGTVRDVVNSWGVVQNHLKYDAFGRVTSESNDAIRAWSSACKAAVVAGFGLERAKSGHVRQMSLRHYPSEPRTSMMAACLWPSPFEHSCLLGVKATDQEH